MEVLFSTDTRKGRDIHKLDRSGTYTLFEGITIVMPLQSNLSGLFNDLNEILKQERKIQSLLPYSSYHITLSGIRCRRDYNTIEEYNQYIENNYKNLEVIKAEINSIEFNQKVKFKLNLRKSRNTHFTIFTGLMIPADDASEQYLKKILDICKEYLGGVIKDNPDYHLSLAYKTPGNKSDLSDLDTKRVLGAVDYHLKNKVIDFGKPEICYFRDMCSFIPL